NFCASSSGENSLGSADRATHVRLAAIEDQMRHIEALLVGISQFHIRLDQIHATLELAIGYLSPGSDTTTPEAESSVENRLDTTAPKFRVVAHLNRDGHGARLVPDVAWEDMWSLRLFVTGLLRNMGRSGLFALGCRCWCEVWTPDES